MCVRERERGERARERGREYEQAFIILTFVDLPMDLQEVC